MTTTDETWADLGRAVNSFVEDLEIQGWRVTVRWERPENRVMIHVSDGEEV